MGARRQSGVRAASESTLEIDFYYQGVRCRERLKLAPTPRNRQYAERLLGQVKLEIERGTFDYSAHFPNSRRAKTLARDARGLDLIETRLEQWYEGKKRELEHSTLDCYRRYIYNVLIPHCGRTPLRDFDKAAGRALIASFGPETSAKRINNVLGPLRGTFADAVDEGTLATNPLDGLKVKRRARIATADDIDPFTPPEIRAILQAASEPQLRNYCQFNLGTGLRTSEMIGLAWGDVDFVAGTVRVRRAVVMGKVKAPKTDAGARVVALSPPALDALRAQKAHTFLTGDRVFHNPGTGEAWRSDRAVRVRFKTLLQRAGVRYRYPYQMRHTFASIALSAGENVMWVSKQMGHRDTVITLKTYSRWIPSVVPDAGAKLAAALSAPVSTAQQNADQNADQPMPIHDHP